MGGGSYGVFSVESNWSNLVAYEIKIRKLHIGGDRHMHRQP